MEQDTLLSLLETIICHRCVCVCVCVCLLSNSVVPKSLQPPWTVAHQAPLPMEFSRHEYCSGVPFPIPGDLPTPRIKPVSLASPALAGRFFSI